MNRSRAGLALPGAGEGTVVTVGTFDGVHRGHWHVLEVLTETARRAGRPSVLVTFDPHPLAIVRPDHAPALLSTPAEKIEVLAESGVNYVVFVRFDRKLANYPPERFVDEILVERYGMTHLVIGYDHGFGRGRSGDVDTLRRIGSARGFEVDVVEAVGDGVSAVSSSGIREALAAGDMEAVAAGLGRPYSMRATVVRGDGRGRKLGFPTANLRPPDPSKLIPREGIYAVRGQVRGGQVDGVLHIGPRPTFPGSEPTIEFHIFDFDEDLYGRDVGLSFHGHIRDVVRFDGVPALVAAMQADCDAARRILAGEDSAGG
jgi:riboflavin kinase / FMN adenylyltransferase